MKVVCNTTPLILLSKIRRLDLLAQLYEQVLVPQAVLAELDEKPGPDVEVVHRLIDVDQLRVEDGPPGVRHLPVELGRGEREAIALALACGADLILLDDQEGRTLARSKGLRISGTIGVLLEAKVRGHLERVRPELDRLVESGFWLAETLYDRVVREARE